MKLVSVDASVSALRTLMIGAIDRIESKMGHLWGHDLPHDQDTTEEEDEIYEQFMECRESILDFGNEQICKVKGIKWIKKS
jgi:hypothetical protein